MASKNSYQQAGYYSTIRNDSVEQDLDDNNTCLDCGSRNLIETRDGFACRECGCVLELRALEYHAPYDDKIVQYSTLGTTQIGSNRERYYHPNSVQLRSLQKLQSIKTREELVSQGARIEISRIFGCLNLPASTNELAFKKFKDIWSKLPKGTKYRSVEKLVPIAISATLKLQNVSVNEKELLSLSNTSKKEFTAFKLQLRRFIPHYAKRIRTDYVLQKVLEVSESFELGTRFYYLAKKILLQFWDAISQTKDDVIVGVVASIAALCLEEYKVSVNMICKRLGIQMSAIQYQVKKNFFERFKLNKFKSLVKSADLLKKILVKLNVIESNIAQSGVEIVEVKLGDAQQVRPKNQEITVLAFADTDKKKALVFVHESRKKTIFRNLTPNKNNFNLELNLFELKTRKHDSGVGPPYFLKIKFLKKVNRNFW